VGRGRQHNEMATGLNRAVSAARYSKVTRRLWGDQTFRSLRASEPSPRELWLYFLTCPEQCAVPGIFRAFEGGVADALGWPLEALRESFLEVSTKGLARADWRAGVVVLPKAFFHNKPDSPNHVKGWRGAWDEIPECNLKYEYYHKLKGLVDTLGKAYSEAFVEALVEPCRHQDQEQEQEPEQEQDLREIYSAPNESEFKLRVPQPKKLKRGRRPGARGLIQEDWKPSERCFEILASEGVTADVVRSCLPDFVDYWRGDGGVKADWDATFRGRIRWLKSKGQLPEETTLVEIHDQKKYRTYLVNGKSVRSEMIEDLSIKPEASSG
jgi:hypothetical protein